MWTARKSTMEVASVSEVGKLPRQLRWRLGVKMNYFRIIAVVFAQGNMYVINMLQLSAERPSADRFGSLRMEEKTSIIYIICRRQVHLLAQNRAEKGVLIPFPFSYTMIAPS